MKKNNIIIIFCLVIINVVVFTTVSYLTKKELIKSDFSIGVIDPQVIEISNDDNNQKENIAVKNEGNVPIFIRLSLIYYFVNGEGQIIKNVPVIDEDYSIELSTSSNWIKAADGYYYYKSLLKPNEITDNIVNKYKELDLTDGKKITMEVIVQAIQATPFKAVEESWGIVVKNNGLIVE